MHLQKTKTTSLRKFNGLTHFDDITEVNTPNENNQEIRIEPVEKPYREVYLKTTL